MAFDSFFVQSHPQYESEQMPCEAGNAGVVPPCSRRLASNGNGAESEKAAGGFASMTVDCVCRGAEGRSRLSDSSNN